MSKKHVPEWNPTLSKGLGLQGAFAFHLHFKWQHVGHKEKIVQNRICPTHNRAAGDVNFSLSVIRLPWCPVLTNSYLQGCWVLISDSKGNWLCCVFVFFNWLFFFSSFVPAEIHFYQWDVFVGRKTNSYREIFVFKIENREPKPLWCWFSLDAASHRWKIVSQFQRHPRAPRYVVQLCLPWTTAVRAKKVDLHKCNTEHMLACCNFNKVTEYSALFWKNSINTSELQNLFSSLRFHLPLERKHPCSCSKTEALDLNRSTNQKGYLLVLISSCPVDLQSPRVIQRKWVFFWVSFLIPPSSCSLVNCRLVASIPVALWK